MIKILICDDSAFMRKIFSDTIEADPKLTVIDTAYNGSDALRKLARYDVDVLMLDIEMPELNGLETLEIVAERYPDLPVIMVSALDNRETVFRALEMGAFDFIPKPSGSISLNIDSIKEELVLKIKAAAKGQSPTPKIKKEKNKKFKDGGNFPVIAVGASSGGPKALNKLFSAFPENFPAAFVIVQHMPAGFTETLAARLDSISGLKISEAKQGDKLQPGRALLAPGDFHLRIDNKGRVVLSQEERYMGVRPCVDYMMESTAKIYGERLIGVVLTGMGRDGARGMKKIVDNGGYGIIESKETALVYGMPGAAAKIGGYHEIKPLYEIGPRIINIVEGK
ncbi:MULTISPECIES: chemotaxis response regulator protein-glutamate methylesterase [unclassified Halanaerobium]|uniref:protein-glutamate methylesterase/protein-glutamine glutaminase n=1 Tax=unclassified Halanaerobium TaxID=2641197 RepID=UPI000DF41583|nr:MULTISPECIES: chemotaxis response regulator protein-glutamate methylesterase [unclassified Halanaerobium]RCW48216.1 two-component system chemotaxis response regulator CheB [Halanaerobium sp. MA284_MarDTE_T2]RCW81671.1 two-component system chemotaxis response regulator CheB [Halanaerobium sp. DL-01]